MESTDASRANERALWERHRGASDVLAREALIHLHAKLARSVASGLRRKLFNLGMPWDDIAQSATVGLIEAVDRFDPTQGVHFAAYASKRIRGAILNDIAQDSELAAQVAYRREALRERTASLREHAPRDPFLELVDVAVGLAVGLMLEDTGLFASGGEAAAQARIPDDLDLVREEFLGLLTELNDKQREVIEAHYLHDHKFADIARRMGLSRARVTQLHAEALKRLRSLRLEREKFDVTV